jgi:hypothetical protein
VAIFEFFEIISIFRVLITMHVPKRKGILTECSFSKVFLLKWPKMGEIFPPKKSLMDRVLYLSILVVGNF